MPRSLLVPLALAVSADAFALEGMAEAVCYTVTIESTTSFRYDVKVTSIDAGTGDWYVFGDSGSVIPAIRQTFTNPVFISSDAPFTEFWSSSGGHAGPNTAPIGTGWSFPGGTPTTKRLSFRASNLINETVPTYVGRASGSLPRSGIESVAMKVDVPIYNFDSDALSDACDPDDDNDGKSHYYDCNERNAAVFPGATESCDAIDSNCDGSLVDTFANKDGDAEPDCIDLDDDNDGVVDTKDCAPLDANIRPGATESCDAIDSDCDGDFVDGFTNTDGDATPNCTDTDDDGDGTADASDCGPTDPNRRPGANELCNSVDDDCDGQTDENAVDGKVYYVDADGDTYGSTAIVQACVQSAGMAKNATDCNDAANVIFPGATESCDATDSDCDGDLVDGFTDTDADQVPDCADVDDDNDGAADDVDCNDTDSDVFPGAAELCNGTDDDCDGSTDEDPIDGDTFFVDGDGDGFGGTDTVEACALVDGLSANDEDCDDSAAGAFPGASEDPTNGVDDDCDGEVDEDTDADDDGIPDDVEVALGLDPESSDSDGDGVPDGAELGDDFENPLDTDDDGKIDALDEDDDGDGLVTADEIGDWDGTNGEAPDGDGDGAPDYLDTDSDDDGEPDGDEGLGDDDGDGIPNSSDTDGDGDGVENDEDCDDTNADVNPDEAEVLDGVDNDCDGEIDDLPEVDEDGDGYGPDEDCDGEVDNGFDGDGDGTTSCDGDCDDTNAQTNPNAIEICDEVDNDCNDSVDDECFGGITDTDVPLDDQGGCRCDTPSSRFNLAWGMLLPLVALRRRMAR